MAVTGSALVTVSPVFQRYAHIPFLDFCRWHQQHYQAATAVPTSCSSIGSTVPTTPHYRSLVLACLSLSEHLKHAPKLIADFYHPPFFSCDCPFCCYLGWATLHS